MTESEVFSVLYDTILTFPKELIRLTFEYVLFIPIIKERSIHFDLKRSDDITPLSEDRFIVYSTRIVLLIDGHFLKPIYESSSSQIQSHAERISEDSFYVSNRPYLSSYDKIEKITLGKELFEKKEMTDLDFNKKYVKREILIDDVWRLGNMFFEKEEKKLLLFGYDGIEELDVNSKKSKTILKDVNCNFINKDGKKFVIHDIINSRIFTWDKSELKEHTWPIRKIFMIDKVINGVFIFTFEKYDSDNGNKIVFIDKDFNIISCLDISASDRVKEKVNSIKIFNNKLIVLTDNSITTFCGGIEHIDPEIKNFLEKNIPRKQHNFVVTATTNNILNMQEGSPF